MNETQMALGMDWTGQELSGWYLMEKLDGCRGYWDGKVFWTRSGKIVVAPEHITKAMPQEPVDGEFWAGRGNFAKASSAVRLGGQHWDGVEFVPFDYPNRAGDWQARTGRGVVCKNNRHATALMVETISKGGEGLIARRAGEAYRVGRTNDILKMKQGR